MRKRNFCYRGPSQPLSWTSRSETLRAVVTAKATDRFARLSVRACDSRRKIYGPGRLPTFPTRRVMSVFEGLAGLNAWRAIVRCACPMAGLWIR